jgi:hypothetical protein
LTNHINALKGDEALLITFIVLDGSSNFENIDYLSGFEEILKPLLSLTHARVDS